MINGLLVGIGTADDAGVVRLDSERALVQTLDFFAPIVDDPYRFGRIAAANALSDVYAMAAKPFTAMNVVAFPLSERGNDELIAILRGGADAVLEAGALLVGGHTVEDTEPKYGLAVTGLVHPDRLATNAGARPGDTIILTKPIGTGVITTAAKMDACPPEAMETTYRVMETLSRSASLAVDAIGIGAEGVHAMTDITGFGLLGHLYNVARASSVRIAIDASKVPILPEAIRLWHEGYATGGELSNREYMEGNVEFPSTDRNEAINLFYDPQTSGGLAIFVEPKAAPRLMDELEKNGVEWAAAIGEADEPSQVALHVF